MDEYNKINWKCNTLTAHYEFINDSDLKQSYIYDLIENGSSKIKKYRSQLSNQDDVIEGNLIANVPGHKFYFSCKKKSNFDENEHLKFIAALKVLKFQKKTDFLQRQDLEFYNNSRQSIIEENKLFLNLVESIWKKGRGKKPCIIPPPVYNYTHKERLHKIDEVFSLPQFYKEVDLLPFSYSDEDIEIEMLHTHNALDIGKVAKFFAPTLDKKFMLCENVHHMDPICNSKLTVSKDANIDTLFQYNNIDVVISLGCIKKLINYTDLNKCWHIPIVIKEVKTKVNGKDVVKNVIFIDKPLPKLESNKIDLAERYAKLVCRSSLCKMEGFVYPTEEVPLVTYETMCSKSDNDSDTAAEKSAQPKILHNAAYKIWDLQPKNENNALMKGQLSSHTFRVLVRAKLDACEINESGALQAVTVVPKLEYQLPYGASICTKGEILKQWASLYFKPFSNLYRIRTPFMKPEVVHVETCNLSQINNEAKQHYNLKPQLGLGILYKIFHSLKTYPKGNYLLHHEPKQGPFAVLMEEQKEQSSFDLHKLYKFNTKISNDYRKPWCPIDVSILLPIFEYKGHMAGLFPPRTPIEKKFHGPYDKKKVLTPYQKKMKNKKKKIARKLKERLSKNLN